MSIPTDKLLHLLVGCAMHPFGILPAFMATVWGGAVTLVQINAMLVPHG